MKRRIFRQVFILYLIVLGVSVVFINFYLTRVLSKSYIDDLTQGLSVQAAIIGGSLPSDASPDLDEFCRKMKQAAGAGITIIDSDGSILGDSDNVSKAAQADGPEITQARISETGHSIRPGDISGHEMLYVARKIIVSEDRSVFVRLAIPMTKVNEAIDTLRLKINFAVILIFLSFGLVALWQTERIKKFFLQIAEHAGAMVRGLSNKKLYLEDAGEFTELAHHLNDMSLKLEATTKTRDEEAERLHVILKSIPDALLIINEHGTIQLSNNAARELMANNHLDGRLFIEVVRSPVFLNLIDEVKKKGSPGSAELMFDFPLERHVFVSISPLYYQAEVLAGFVAIFHDTTQMKKLEQMRKDFVANVSHEIKTPITAIKGFAETLLDGALYDRENAEKFLTTIKNHSERLNRLVEDLLTISKLELGGISINKAEFNITDIIDEVIQVTALQAAEKNVSVRKSIAGGETLLFADRDRVAQILLNIIDNALKFTEKGEIEIGVSQEDSKNYFFVRDTGVGIPEKYLSRLGERFFRVDPSRSRQLGGTGLGLAIVKHIVKSLGWEMKIESEEGRGTVVKIFYL